MCCSYRSCRGVLKKTPRQYDCHVQRLELRRRGTFAPFLRASDKPIAIACLRLFTRPPFPPLPLRSVPLLRRRIALSTRLLAARPYLGIVSSGFVTRDPLPG